MEIVVLVERGQVVARERQRQQVEIGVQLVIVAHYAVVAAGEFDLAAHVRVAYLRGDVAHLRTVGHLGGELGIKLVGHGEDGVHARTVLPCRQPVGGDADAVVAEGQHHLSAHIGEPLKECVRVLDAECGKQRIRDFLAEHGEHGGKVRRTVRLEVGVNGECIDVAAVRDGDSREEGSPQIEEDVRQRLHRRVGGGIVVRRAQQPEDVEVLYPDAGVGYVKPGGDVHPRCGVVRDQREKHAFLRRRLRRLRHRVRVHEFYHKAGLFHRVRVIVEPDEQIIRPSLARDVGAQHRPQLPAVQCDVFRHARGRVRKIPLPRHGRDRGKFLPLVAREKERCRKTQHHHRDQNDRRLPSFSRTFRSHVVFTKHSVYSAFSANERAFCARSCFHCLLNVQVISSPQGTLDAALIVPPIPSTMAFAMASPSPVPGTSLTFSAR